MAFGDGYAKDAVRKLAPNVGDKQGWGSFLSKGTKFLYRVTRHVESYILLRSIWGVPPVCGPLLQLATAQAGQGIAT